MYFSVHFKIENVYFDALLIKRKLQRRDIGLKSILVLNYVSNYNDKAELLLILDDNFEFIQSYYKLHKGKSLKIWMIDILENYLHFIEDNNRDKVSYGELIYKFSTNKYKNFGKLLNTYFKKKYETLVTDFYELHYKPESLVEEPVINQKETTFGELINLYKKYFKGFRIHMDRTIDRLRSLKINGSPFKRTLLEDCNKMYTEGYHRVLTIFLETDTKDIDKRKIFKFYANEIENKLRRELEID